MTMVRVRKALIGLIAVLLAALACLAVRPAFRDPVVWTPDALYYQARLLELRGASSDEAIERTFGSPLSAELRARDPHHTGNPEWVAYNRPFYERRLAVPAAGAVLYPHTGDRSLLYVSLAGYVASIVALFGLLLLRFGIPVAAAVAVATIVLPPLQSHSSYPLTDSWGLTLEIAALAAAILALDRGMRWLIPWVAAIALLGITRDTTWIPIAAVAWCAFRYRSRVTGWLLGTGIAAALPALVLFEVPVRNLLALLVNDLEPSSDTSWGFIASNYPRSRGRPPPRECRLPAPRRVVHGGVLRRGHPPALPARAPPSRAARPGGDADASGRRGRRPVRAGGAGVQRVSASSSSSCRWPHSASRSGSRRRPRPCERECPSEPLLRHSPWRGCSILAARLGAKPELRAIVALRATRDNPDKPRPGEPGATPSCPETPLTRPLGGDGSRCCLGSRSERPRWSSRSFR